MKVSRYITFIISTILFFSLQSWAQSQNQMDAFGKADTKYLQAHFNQLVPQLLEHYKLPGLTLAIIENGELSFKKSYGYANIEKKIPVKSSTIFNVGSLSKPMTAWGVINLVQQGKLNLDEPVNNYLKNWQLESDTIDVEKITVHRLLSHTAGLSLAAVPEYDTEQLQPSLISYLRDSGEVYAKYPPGSVWSYSGGGYMILQKVIEDVSGQSFEAYMNEKVFQPLGMSNSAFSWNKSLMINAAKPYHQGEATSYFTYTGKAAASMNTNLDDLIKWTMASISMTGGKYIPKGTVTSSFFLKMIQPAPDAIRPYGTTYGLGYELWPLGNKSYLTGHNGQNTGWSSGLWFNPVTRDGFIVLINDSQGYNTWRWLFCDWMYWSAKVRWQGICSGRPDNFKALTKFRTEPDNLPDNKNKESQIDHFTDSLFKNEFSTKSPGASVLVAKGSTIIHRSSYGLASVEKEIKNYPGTDFYIASLSKPFTALAILLLVKEGKLKLDDKLNKYIRELPPYSKEITIRQLLNHSSGIPDYYRYIKWSNFKGLSNAAVLDTLKEKEMLDFIPGSKFEYSNSNYVILSVIVERISGLSLSVFLKKNIFHPYEMYGSFVYDDTLINYHNRAYGYSKKDTLYLPMDYIDIRLQNGTSKAVGFTTTGGGGIYSNIDDMFKWQRRILKNNLIEQMVKASMLTYNKQAFAVNESYGNGIYNGSYKGKKLIWHGGNFVGFSGFLLMIPEDEFTIIILSNQAQTNSRNLALQILNKYLVTRKEIK